MSEPLRLIVTDTPCFVRAVLTYLFSVAFLIATSPTAQAGGMCQSEPRLHFSVDSDIRACTAAIHNGSGGAGMGGARIGSGPPPESRAEGYYERGLLYSLQGKIDLAIADYTSAIGWQRTYADAYEARGDAYADLGQPEKANTDYETAYKISGDGLGGLGSRCWMRAVRGHPLDRALSDCNKFLRSEPDNKDVLQSRCFVYYRMGNYSAAITDCAAAEKLQPRFADALYVGGLAKLRQGDTAGGDADIAAARDADYEIADLYALYGVKP